MSRQEPEWYGGPPDDDLLEALKEMLASRYLFAVPADSPAHGQAAAELYGKIGAYFKGEIEDGMICCPAHYSKGVTPPAARPDSWNGEHPVQCFYAAKAIFAIENGRQYL